MFDRQSAYFEQSRTAFLEVCRSNPDWIKCLAGSPREATDETVLPLQAAEWLVWQIRKSMAANDANPIKPDELFILGDGLDTAAFKSLPIYIDIWDRKRMKEMRDEFVLKNINSLDGIPEHIRPWMRQHLEKLL